MPKDTKVKSNSLRELDECCNGVLDNLARLSDQLTKIIEIKKKTYDSARSGVGFGQAQDILGTIANLEQINSGLSRAIGEVKQLSQQMQLLCKQQLVL